MQNGNNVRLLTVQTLKMHTVFKIIAAVSFMCNVKMMNECLMSRDA